MAADLPLTASLVLALVSGWGGVWQDIADRARTFAEPASPYQDASMAVRTVDPGPVVVAGTLAGVNWQWNAGRIKVRANPRLPRELRVDLAGPQLLNLDGDAGPVRVRIGGTGLRAVLTTDRRGRVAAAAMSGAPVAIQVGGLEFLADSLQIATLRQAPDTVHVELAADGWALPPAMRPPPPLDRPIGHARATAKITAVDGDAPWTLARWRDRGGYVQVEEMMLDWDGFLLDGRGRVALDALLRPRGRVWLGMRGLPDVVRAAETAGWLDARARAKVEDMLGRIATVRGEDDIDLLRLDLSLALAGGRMSWQGLPITTLPALGPGPDCEALAGPRAC